MTNLIEILFFGFPDFFTTAVLKAEKIEKYVKIGDVSSIKALLQKGTYHERRTFAE